MSDQTNFLLRKATGDQPVGNEQELREWLQRGQCKPADLLFDFATGSWGRVADHKALVDLFSVKPYQIPERKLIYYMSPGSSVIMQGPHSTQEIQARIQSRELCWSTWIFVEGDKEWRQLRNVKILAEMFPALPLEAPAKPVVVVQEIVAAPAALDLGSSFPAQGDGDKASLTQALEGLELSFGEEPPSASASAPAFAPPSEAPVSAPAFAPTFAPMPMQASAPALGSADHSISFDMENPEVEREDPTMAFSVLGLSLANAEPPPMKATPPKAVSVAPAPAMPPPIKAAMPSAPPSAPSLPPSMPSAAALSVASEPPRVSLTELTEADTGSFDGITAQIPVDPIWLVKRGNLETVAGPFRFLEVIKLLEEGKLNKNDKISRVGTNRFVKIAQQYEFNVKFSVETVVANGVEQQRIVIKRRHPRISYMTDVQIIAKGVSLVAACVNISAGGILIEMSKGDFTLGEIIDIKMMPSLINKMIACKSMVIGKIPKIPPGFALKFENLKPEDKEAIEFFVTESLKREMQKNS